MSKCTWVAEVTGSSEDLKRTITTLDKLEQVDCLVNKLCEELSADELAYLLSQMVELNRRGAF